MRRIAIVGAGQAGLLAAHGLHQRGYDVTLYSDRSAEDFLAKARPTGTAARFKMSLDFERELGLEHWSDVAPHGEGIHLTFCQKQGNQFLTLCGRFADHFLAIDVRLQSATWMRELKQAGARVEIVRVGVPELEEIASEHDLTVVAAGRGEIMELFPRDEQRSSYSTPQRRLAMVNVVGPSMTFPYAPWFTPVKFNFFAPIGECFWVPWYSKGGQQSWSLVFEGKEGSPLDRFRDCTTPDGTLARAKEVIADVTPWDAEWVKDAELCDENAWLVGSFTPEIRQVAGFLPSGRAVMALGDTAHSLDPIGGQGANNGNKMARNLVECVAKREDRPFDADWMRATFERFWDRHRHIEMFNCTLLEPLTTAGKLVLLAQVGSTAENGRRDPAQRLADLFCDNFDDPARLTEAFHDMGRAKAVLREHFEGAWLRPVLRGALKVGRGQIRQATGRPANHPGMTPFA